MTERQILWRVEIPLATPEIIGGLRIAIVSTIAIATLAVFAHAGGLGTQIYGEANLTLPDVDPDQHRDRRSSMALFFDAILLTIQHFATPWRRARPS